MKFSGYFIAFLLSLACAEAGQAAAVSEQTTVEPNRFGTIAVGMAPSAIAKTSGMQLVLDKDAGGNAHCFYTNFTGDNAPDGISLMIQNDRLSAFTVYNPNIINAEHIGIGSTADDVEKIYAGKWHTRVNPYGNKGDEDIIVAADPHFGYVFYMSQGKVNYYSAGIYNSILKVAGCS